MRTLGVSGGCRFPFFFFSKSIAMETRRALIREPMSDTGSGLQGKLQTSKHGLRDVLSTFWKDTSPDSSFWGTGTSTEIVILLDFR